jgi:hypothetical protein
LSGVAENGFGESIVTTSQDWWKLLALTLLFGGASLVLLGSLYDPLDPALATARWILVGGALAVMLPFVPSAIARFVPRGRSAILISLWLAFGACCLLSAIATEDNRQAIVNTLWLLLVVPPLFLIGLPLLLGEKGAMLVTLALLISHVFYLAVSLCLYPDLHFEYKGIFGHPNGMGVTAAIVAITSLCCLVEAVQLGSRGGLLGGALALLFAGSSFLVMVSGSRTSLLAVLAAAALGACVCVGRLRRVHVLSLALGGLMLFWAGSTVPNLGIAQQIWQKHADQVTKGDTLSKRDEIWMKVIDDMHWLGNGSDYFPGTVGISSHNSIMFIIGQQGPIAAFFIVCVAVLGLAWSTGRAFRERARKPFSAAPAMVSVCFWVLSMGEGMFGAIGTGITLAYLLSVGVTLADDMPIGLPELQVAPCPQPGTTDGGAC